MAIAKEEYLVDLFANPITLQRTSPKLLISMGLLPSDSKVKTTILNGIKTRMPEQLNTLEKLRIAVSEELQIVQTRKNRLSAIIEKINSSTT